MAGRVSLDGGSTAKAAPAASGMPANQKIKLGAAVLGIVFGGVLIAWTTGLIGGNANDPNNAAQQAIENVTPEQKQEFDQAKQKVKAYQEEMSGGKLPDPSGS